MTYLYGPALKRTISVLRREHPGMWNWVGDSDTAHQKAVEEWKSSPEVSALLETVKYRRHDRTLRKLLGQAREFLADQDGEVRRHWQESQPVLDTACDAVRHVAWVLFSKALLPGEYGGPNVLMSYVTVIDMVRAQFGTELDLSSVRYARDWLVRNGVLTVTPGQKRQAGHRQRATVWHLCNKPSPGEGPIAQDAGVLVLPSAGVSRLPALGYSPELYREMEKSFALQRIARQERWEDGWWTGKPSQSPDYSFVSDLLAA